jgi:hypothetical protein
MKRIILIYLLTASSSILLSQAKDSTQIPKTTGNVHLNILGDGSLIGLNFEIIFIQKEKFLLIGKLGMGYNEEFKINLCLFGPCPDPEPAKKFVTFPHSLTFNFGKGKHFFEAGLGGTLISGDTDQNYLFYPTMGYRLQPFRVKKFTFRIFGSLPFTGTDTEDILYLPAGISFGLSF